MPVAAVFGSSAAAQDDPCCRIAAALGAGLARLGYTVRNGGYTGVMEAVSRGAAEAGGHVVGVTVSTLPREPNAYLSETIVKPDLTSRQGAIIDGADIFFAIEAGGPGTLHEFFQVWAMTVLGELSDRPIVLIGDGWPELLAVLQKHFAVGDRLMAGVITVADVDSALQVAGRLLRQARSES